MDKEKKGDSLNDFVPDEAEEPDKRLVALEAQLGIVIKSLKTQTERIDALVELYSDVNNKVGEALEKTYPGDIANAIREIRDTLLARKPLGGYMRHDEVASVAVDLSAVPSREQLDVSTVGGTTVIKAKMFLGDLWGPVNDAIKALGGTWIRDGKNSRWEIGGSATSTPPQQKEKPQIKNPDDPASAKQIAFLKQLKVYVKPNLTKGEASKLIDHKLGEKK